MRNVQASILHAFFSFLNSLTLLYEPSIDAIRPSIDAYLTLSILTNTALIQKFPSFVMAPNASHKPSGIHPRPPQTCFTHISPSIHRYPRLNMGYIQFKASGKVQRKFGGLNHRNECLISCDHITTNAKAIK